MITQIVFSMDRAFQCDSLLRSLKHNSSGLDKIVVLARASSPLHEEAYRRLQEDHRDVSVRMETDKPCSVMLAHAIEDTDYVGLAVDDQFFYRELDYAFAVDRLEAERAFVWSWRLGHKEGVTQLRAPRYWLCSSLTDDRDCGYLWHSDGSLYRKNDYVNMLDRYLPEWCIRPFIPNDLEQAVAARVGDWRMNVGPHIGPALQKCMTWQINKVSTTKGKYGAPWFEIISTGLDALAEKYVGGLRLDNAELYINTEWTTRFQQFDSLPTHVHACMDASRFYAKYIKDGVI